MLGWKGVGLALCIALQCGGTAVFGQELKSSPRPPSNPIYKDVSAPVPVPEASPSLAQATVITASLRAPRRPDRLEQKSPAASAAVEPKAAKNPGGIELASARVAPPARDDRVSRQEPAKPSRKQAQVGSAKGSVCGVAAIKGQVIGDMGSKVNGCGLSDGVRVTSISGVRLSTAITVDCSTARALNTWVERAVQPAYGNRVVELKIAGSYVCRTRNHKKGAKVSEHGRGRAVDVSGFVLSNGKTHMVLRGFDKTMRQAHKGACGIFGTTLGPGSDGYHEDHLHLDTARHGNGAYCR